MLGREEKFSGSGGRSGERKKEEMFGMVRREYLGKGGSKVSSTEFLSWKDFLD